MKLKSLLTFSLLLLSVPAFAEQPKLLGVQAGDIAMGKEVQVEQFDMVSYYKPGKSGKITFTCFLGGSGVVSSLWGGKNFSTETTYLRTGINGPYTWMLHDYGYNEGNIRLRIYKGTDVYVRCKQEK